MDKTHLSCIKKNCAQERGALVFGDEAAFRLEPTLFQTWSRLGCQPQIRSYGQKQTQHVFGGIRIPQGDFFYRFAKICNGHSFRIFLGALLQALYPLKIFLVLDNARYHKEPGVMAFCRTYIRRLSLWFLPTYSPELNAIEPIWGYTRRQTTHNRFFEDKDELIASVKKTFRNIQYHPEKIKNYLTAYV